MKTITIVPCAATPGTTPSGERGDEGTAIASAPSTVSRPYFVPLPSRHPVVLAACLLALTGALAAWLNDAQWGKWAFAFALSSVCVVLVQWFGQAISESESGCNGEDVDRSFRWSMSWFIFSEVMFFSGFFGSLLYARVFALPDLASVDARLLWPQFVEAWPNTGPAELITYFRTVGPWPLPTFNTALLLASGVTLTISHHALQAGRRRKATHYLGATLALGVMFLGCQALEYLHAYHALNLTLRSGVYGALFFLLTGFHGFHVMLGATMLAVIWRRMLRGDFTPTRHFGFEGAAWYWHFVDVVWLGLYIAVYWL